MDLKQTYNKIAEDWYKDHKQDTWWVDGTNKFVSLLKTGSLVLDVGCGGGFKSQYLIRKGLRVIGIDFSEKMIGIAKRGVPSGTFFVMDMEDIAALQEEFDGIFMQAVLLHVPKKDIKKILNKILNKLKAGGYLYLAVKEKKSNGPEGELKIEADYGYAYERFFSYFKLDEIKEVLQKADFEIIYENVTPSGNARWIQVIGRKATRAIYLN